MSTAELIHQLQKHSSRKETANLKLDCRPLSSVQREEIKWLWLNRIPENTLTLIEGDGGRGKSTVTASICSALSQGLKLPDDDTEREPRKILLLAPEDDSACVKRPRFESHGANLDMILFDDQSMILNENGLGELEKAIRQHGISVVVIDPIVSFLGQRIDMNKGNDVRSVLGPLVKLGRELNCTFIVVRHFNKSREGSASQRGAGSVDFRNAARSVLQVIHSDGKSYLALEKSNYAAMAKTLTFTIENGSLKWSGVSDMTADEIHNESQNSGENRSAIEEAIEFLEIELKDGPKAAPEITRHAKENGISDKTLQRAKAKRGVKSLKLPSGWKWQLEVQDGQGGQDSLTGNDDHVDHLGDVATGQQLEATFI